MIYLIPEQEDLFSKENNFPLIIKTDNSSSQLNFLSNLINSKEDDIDLQLDKIDGRISRELDPHLYENLFFILYI